MTKFNLERGNWQLIESELGDRGYAQLKEFLSEEECLQFIEMYDHQERFRKTVVMESYRYGKGEYKYFDYPMPDLLQEIRESIYLRLTPVANQWMTALKINKSFPDTHDLFIKQCKDAGQLKATPLLLKYIRGGYNTLHQDLYGEIFFPLQAAIFLNEPDKDYYGGEFVLTEQIPRAQSKAIVIQPARGDMIIFASSFRPGKSQIGYYKINMRHGVSEVKQGIRHTLGIIFHDALN